MCVWRKELLQSAFVKMLRRNCVIVCVLERQTGEKKEGDLAMCAM